MEMTQQERLEKLLNAYSHHYDIARDVTVEGGTFPATAFFFLRDENYLISKKHVLSAVENHEYVYFYLTEHLTAEELQKQIDLSKKAGMGHIKPSKEHMSSFVTLVILADNRLILEFLLQRDEAGARHAMSIHMKHLINTLKG